MLWYSSEVPLRGTSNEYHNMFMRINKKNIIRIPCLTWSYGTVYILLIFPSTKAWHLNCLVIKQNANSYIWWKQYKTICRQLQPAAGQNLTSTDNVNLFWMQNPVFNN